MANWANVGALGDPSGQQWQKENLVTIELPNGQKWQVLKQAEQAFRGLLSDLQAANYNPTSSGGYNYRPIRGSTKLSQHAFGNAIDINAATNPLGSRGTDMPANIGELAAKHGIEWGGTWKNRPDPMHFEWKGGGATPQGPEEQFVKTYYPMIQKAVEGTGVDPQLALAQFAQETGWGKNIRGNNPFNITGGGVVRGDTDATGKPIQQSFREYPDIESGVKGYVDLISSNPRYAKMLEGSLAERQAALGGSGYAQDPKYGEHVGERLGRIQGLINAGGTPAAAPGATTPATPAPPDTGTGGVITAQGPAAPAPLMALQGFADQMKKQEEQKAPPPVQQAPAPAAPPPAQSDPSQVQAADLMGSLLARKRAMYAGGAPQQPPGILNPWAA
jgi:hypothetical protein